MLSRCSLTKPRVGYCASIKSMFVSYIVYATDVPEDMEGPAVFNAARSWGLGAIAPRDAATFWRRQGGRRQEAQCRRCVAARERRQQTEWLAMRVGVWLCIVHFAIGGMCVSAALSNHLWFLVYYFVDT